jgi:transcriptional regulator with XRE-family HTH domain
MYDFSVLRGLRRREKLSIQDVSDRSGVSAAVISKLERNLTVAELETLSRLGKVFGMNPSDILALAESPVAHRRDETAHQNGAFSFRDITYGNIKCLMGLAEKGAKISTPEIHGDDYELCWVLDGALTLTLPNETLALRKGEAAQFDAMLGHTYEAAEDVKALIIHIKKPNRF